MTFEKKTEAITIIAKSNSPIVSFNVPVKMDVSNTHDILIHSCNADLINRLIKAGFSLTMCDKGLTVDFY